MHIEIGFKELAVTILAHNRDEDFDTLASSREESVYTLYLSEVTVIKVWS